MDKKLPFLIYFCTRADARIKLYLTILWVLNSEIDEDIIRLTTIAVGILSDSRFNGPTLSEDLIHEMFRFGGAELNAVAAFIGGVASQEVIKVCDYH